MTGEDNTATGRSALQSNTTGDDNTATGVNALRLNMTGNNNTATGFDALSNNTTSGGNTAIGRNALLNHTTGSNNVAVGFGAGALHETGNANIYVNHVGVATESNTIRIGTQGTQTATFIAGISDTELSGMMSNQVWVDDNGRLGTVSGMISSRKYKTDVRDMGQAPA